MSLPSAEPAVAGVVPLTRLAEGQRAVVAELTHAEDPAAAHLAAVGVLPGAAITLVQRYPSFVFQIGHAEFAVDAELAARILVTTASSRGP